MKMKEKTHKRITQKEIDLIKALLVAGIKKNKIKEISGRSGFSIKIVEQSDGTLKDYHRKYHENRDEWLKRKAVKDQGQESVSVDQGTDEIVDQKIEVDLAESAIKSLQSVQNALMVMNQRIEHIEKMMGEHIESHQAELTLLKSKKIIW